MNVETVVRSDQYAGAPYKDKFTLFANEEDMKDSINNGFTVLDAKNKEIKIRIGEKEEVVRADQPSGILNKGLAQLICTVIDQYAYLHDVNAICSRTGKGVVHYGSI